MDSEAPIIMVSPDMRPSVMGVARSLSEANLLQRFVTTVATGNGHDPAGFKYLPKGLRNRLGDQLKRRQVPDFLDVPIETVQFPEMINLAARRFGVGEVRRHRIWEWAETSFDHTVAERWAGKAPCIYGCEHASVETFRKQRRAGGYNILWQVIAHHQTMTRLLREEMDADSSTATAYQRELSATLPRINARKDEQYADADLIVTNSEFARQTFIEAGLPSGKLKSAPTGCPPVLFGAVEERQRSPMIFLSAGSQSVRKGVPYLLEAWRRLQPLAGAELWLVGEMELAADLLKNLPTNVVIKPPVARDELETILRRASVLVLPTLGEGLAHIVLEALSAGLAIVTTENSGCGDLVEDGVNGWKIPIRDSDALGDRLSWCLDHPLELTEMQGQSQRKAAGWQQEHFVAAHTKIIKAFLVEKGISEHEQRWAPAYAG